MNWNKIQWSGKSEPQATREGETERGGGVAAARRGAAKPEGEMRCKIRGGESRLPGGAGTGAGGAAR